MDNEPKSFSIKREQKQYITPQMLAIIFLTFVSIVGGFMLTRANPVVVIGAVGVVVYIAVLFVSPYVGVLVYLVFEYARLSAMFPALQALQIGKLIVVPTLLMLVVHAYILRDRKIVPDKIYTLLLAWLFLAVVSAPFAVGPTVWEAIFTLLKWFITVFIIVNLVTSLPKFQYFIWLLLLLNLKMSQHQIRAFYYGMQHVSSNYRNFFIEQGVGAGSTSFFANATDFGMAMVVVLPLAIYLIPSVKSKILKLFAAGTLGAFVISILKSGSRGAAVAMFAMVVLYWFKSKNKVVMLVVIVLFTMAFWSLAPAAWQERFKSAGDYQEDATAMQRIDLWKAGLKMFMDHPFFGVGVDQYAYAFDNGGYRPAGYSGASVAHNVFIQAIAELGIGGLSILILLIIILFKRNIETRKIYKRAGLNEKWLWNFSLALDLSLLGFVVGGSFLTILYYPHLYIIMGMVLALHHTTKKIAEKSAPGGIAISHV